MASYIAAPNEEINWGSSTGGVFSSKVSLQIIKVLCNKCKASIIHSSTARINTGKYIMVYRVNEILFVH